MGKKEEEALKARVMELEQTTDETLRNRVSELEKDLEQMGEENVQLTKVRQDLEVRLKVAESNAALWKSKVEQAQSAATAAIDSSSDVDLIRMKYGSDTYRIRSLQEAGDVVFAYQKREIDQRDVVAILEKA